jgi:hypothetical protein
LEIHQDFSELLSEFIAEGVRFLVVGGYAVGVHARPRMTKDLDLFVARDAENAGRVYRALARFGAPLEGVTESDFTNDDLIYQMGQPPVRIDIITAIEGVGFDEAWRGRLAISVAGMNVYVIGKEELIRNKKSVGRPQDLADVDAIMKSSR